MRRVWTEALKEELRRRYHAEGAAPLAAEWGLTASAVRCQARKLGLLTRHPPLTPAERARVAELHRAGAADREIAADLGCSLATVALALLKAGFPPRKVFFSRMPDFDARVAALHARGLADREIAEGLGVGCRKTIRDARRRLGLPDNALSAHRRGRVAAATRDQLARAGLRTLGELRADAYRRYAAGCGWPADLRPRAVQILNALAARGPMDRRELAAAVGMPWKGSRKSLASNDPEGSYLAHLQARGLVVRLRKARRVTGRGSGRSVDLYTLAAEAIQLIEERSHGRESEAG